MHQDNRKFLYRYEVLAEVNNFLSHTFVSIDTHNDTLEDAANRIKHRRLQLLNELETLTKAHNYLREFAEIHL